MARDTFQPILSDIGPAEISQQRLPTVDVSPIGNAIKSFAKIRADKAENAKDLRNTEDLATLQIGLLDLQNERERTNQFEEDLRTELSTLRNDNIIDDNQFNEFKRVETKLEALKSMKSQGIGSDREFRVRRNALFQTALSENPALASAFNSLFNGQVSQVPESQADIEEQQITSVLRKRYGDNYGLAEYEALLGEATLLQTAKMEKELGTITASQLSSKIPSLVSTINRDWTIDLVKKLGAGNVLSVEEEATKEQELIIGREQAHQQLDEWIASAQQNNKIFTNEQITGLKAQVDREYEQKLSLLKGKDVQTRAKVLLNLENYALQNNLPPMFKYFTQVDSAGGTLGMQNMLQILLNPGLKERLTVIGRGYLKNIDVDIDQVIGQAYTLMLTGQEVSDPGLKDIQTVLAGSIIKSQKASPEVVSTFINNTADKVKDSSGAIVPGNIKEAAKVLNSKGLARGFVENMSTADKNALENQTGRWTTVAVNDTIQKLVETGKAELVGYDAAKNEFFIQGGAKFREEAAVPEVAYFLTRLQSGIDNMNAMLDLSDNPYMKGLTPTADSILGEWNKQFEKTFSQQEDQSTN